jgi:hypothetical protein
VQRDAAFWVKHGVVVPTDAAANQQTVARDWLAASWASLHPWGTGGVFPNFADADLEDWGHAYYGSNYERLVELKARYDPDNLFRFSQSIPVS